MLALHANGRSTARNPNTSDELNALPVRANLMIDYQKNRIFIECDLCDEIFEGEENEELNKVWSLAKRDGWKSRKIGNDYVHGCPTCKV